MYQIFADNICIYDDKSPMATLKVLNPKLTMEDNAAGKLEFTLPADSAGYPVIHRLSSKVSVFKDGEEIWSGRVITENKDFYNQRKLTCEGELAYLNDTTQPMAEYHLESSTVVDDFLKALINNHNSKATSDMQFEVGIVTVTDPNGYLYRYTNYESTLACIKEKLIDKLGGHLRIRKENGVRKLDYISDYYDVSGQSIEFGKNLIDFTTSWDLTELATVVLPLGNQLEDDQRETNIEALVEYLTVKDADYLNEDGIKHNSGSIYVQADSAISTYGWIETVVRWDDVSDKNNLLTKAKKYLMDAQFEKMVLELSAVDLHNLNPEIEALKLLHRVECISPPHGMDRMFPVTKMDIPLDKPEDTVYTLGTSIQTSMSAKVREGNKELLEKVEDSSFAALTRAKKHAAEIINSKTRGYITIDTDENNEYSQELIISDTKDPTKATRLWVWNMGGLGFFPNGRYENNGDKKIWGDTYTAGMPNVAITMDGRIVADFITVGTLDADKIDVVNIKAGNVTTGILQDSAGYNYWNLDTGEFRLTGGVRIKDVVRDEYVVTSDKLMDRNKTYYHSDSSGNYVQVTSSDYQAIIDARLNMPDSNPNDVYVDEASYYFDSPIYEHIHSVETKSLSEFINQSGLTQEELFNKLTNNGKNDGVFMLSNEQLFINGTYIKARTLKADAFYTSNITDTEAGVAFNSGASFNGSIIGKKNGMIEGDITIHGDLKVKGDIKAGGGYSEGISGEWDIGGKKYKFTHGILTKRE